MYRDPQFQLPERAQSLHTIDWQGAMEELVKGIVAGLNLIGEALASTLTPIIQAVVDGIEDATRDNAYHPQGPVIYSTGFTLPDDQRLLE